MKALVWLLGMALVLGCQMDDGDGEVKGGNTAKTGLKDSIGDNEIDLEKARKETEAQDQQDSDAEIFQVHCLGWELVTNPEQDNILTKKELKSVGGATGKIIDDIDGQRESVWRRDVRQFIKKNKHSSGCYEQEYYIKGYPGGDTVSVDLGDGACSVPSASDEPIYQYLVITRQALRCAMESPSDSDKLLCRENEKVKTAPDRVDDAPASQHHDVNKDDVSAWGMVSKGAGFTFGKNESSGILPYGRYTAGKNSFRENGYEFDGLTYIYIDSDVSPSGCSGNLRAVTVRGVTITGNKSKRKVSKPLNATSQ